jgi:hypothetical protein
MMGAAVARGPLPPPPAPAKPARPPALAGGAQVAAGGGALLPLRRPGRCYCTGEQAAAHRRLR